MKRNLNKGLCLLGCLAMLLLLTVSPRAAVSPSASCASLYVQGSSRGVVTATAVLSDEVNSWDDYYYLCEVNAATDKLLAIVDKKSKAEVSAGELIFGLDLLEDPSVAMRKYCLAVKTKKGSSLKTYTRISPTAFVRNPEEGTLNTSPYQRGTTKKGLQGADINQQQSTKSKNCFLNLNVSTLLSNATQGFTYQGETYYFNPLRGISYVVSQCNQAGGSVTLQFMLDAASPKQLMANGGSGGAHYYAWKVKDATARRWMDAMFCYLAQIFGSDTCHVDNWILGNEVNSSFPYFYMGQVSLKEFVENYALTFRDLYNAVRSHRGSSQVYICLEHCWTIHNQTKLAFPGKQVLSQFHKQLAKLQDDVLWNLAYHPYPDNFKNPKFWNESVDDDADAEIFTPLNINSLTSYLQKTYGRERSLILSEIGFNAGNNEDAQAAAIALSYYIAACNPVIDAIIFRSYEDEPSEAAMGLKFGISGRKAFSVFQVMDTRSFSSKTKKLMQKQVGKSWKKKIPGYKSSWMYTNYHD